MSRRLRVCMVHYSDFHIDSRIQRQARALAERGDEVHLVCLSRAEKIPVGEGSIRIHPVPMRKPAGGPRAFVAAYARFFAHSLKHVTALAARGGLDVVEAHNMPDFLTFAAIMPKLRGTPVILNCHDTFPELFATKFGRPTDSMAVRLIHREERLSAAFADHVISVTEEARRRLDGRGVGTGRSSVVMNSPDERVFGPSRPPVAPGAQATTGRLRVLYHGGLAPRFGVETLIRAFGLLDPALDLELRVCGSGEDRDRLAALAADIAPDRIDVAAEPVPFAAIPRELEAADLGVVPTLHDDFTELLLPVKLLEYVHMGLPVVASRLPGILHYFAEDELWAYEAGSPKALAAALAEALARPGEAAGRAERAQERLAEIAWEEQRSRYVALVDEVVAGSRRARRKSAGVRAVASSAAR